MKKILALLLAVVMVFALVACQTGDKNETKGTDAATDASTDAATDAATDAPLDPVTLKIWFHGSNVTPDASAKVMEAVNEYLADKINATIEPIWGTWGDFDTAVVTALAGGDDCDMYFTCNWSANEYNTYARDGYWVRLDGESDLLGKYGADVKAAIPEYVWEMAKANGSDGLGIYAVPGFKDTATQNCWDVNGTRLAELGYDVDAVCEAGLDFYSDAFEEMLQASKDKYGANFYPLNIEPVVLERAITCSTVIAGDSNSVLSYYYDAQDPSKDLGSTIVNKYGTDAYKKYAERIYDFAQKGFINPQDQNSQTAGDARNALAGSGEYLFTTQVYAYGCEIDYASQRGIDVRMVPMAAAYNDCTSGQGAMVAISSASKNPERAMMFLNLLNSDPALMTLMNYGVEGYTYNTNEDGTITFTEERANYTPWRNGMGNVRILPPTDGEGLTYWDDFGAYYDTAKDVPYGAYVFDKTNVADQYAACADVYATYGFNMDAGAVNPATELPKFLEELQAAGIEDVLAEANNQLALYIG